MLVILCLVWGLVIGSFLNVVAYRLPREESLVHPRSRCPGCGSQIAVYDNVPVVSWVALRGRCRDCGTGISARYPVVELVTGLLFAAVGWHFGLVWELPAYLYLAAIAVVLSAIDIDTQRLPDAIVLPSYPVAAVLLGGAAAVERDWTALWHTAVGGLALWAVYILPKAVYSKGMGWGDVKLSGVLGMYLGFLGFGPLVVGGFAGFLLGGLGGIALMLAGAAKWRSRIPYGPYMLAGAFVGIFWGQAIADWYRGVFGLG
jgi:leader peptidase (prepilin peptidase) / N-methyltransferase